MEAYPGMVNFQEKANFIWQVADDILRGTFGQDHERLFTEGEASFQISIKSLKILQKIE